MTVAEEMVLTLATKSDLHRRLEDMVKLFDLWLVYRDPAPGCRSANPGGDGRVAGRGAGRHARKDPTGYLCQTGERAGLRLDLAPGTVLWKESIRFWMRFWRLKGRDVRKLSPVNA
jgi:hypothetical protein